MYVQYFCKIFLQGDTKKLGRWPLK